MRASRAALVVSWAVFITVAAVASRRVLTRDDGDVSGLVVATLAGALGLIVLASWLLDYEGRR